MGRGEQICRSATDKCCPVLHQLKKHIKKKDTGLSGLSSGGDATAIGDHS